MGEVSANGRRRPQLGAVVAWWVAAVALAALLVVWPWVAGMVAMNDDLKFVRVVGQESLAERLGHAWSAAPTFRPLEVLVGWTCDPWTLEPGAVPWVHAAGLVAFCAAVMRLARMAWPGHPAAGPLSIVLVALSPAASVSMWQADTCSQTWTAALGAWSAILAWHAVDGGLGRRPAAGPFAGLLALLAAGVMSKETMYGWGLGLALACAIVAWRSRGSDRDRSWRCAAVAAPCVMVPAAHAALRWLSGGLGSIAKAEEGARYSAELGTNLVVNAAMSAGALLGNGPFHLLTDDAAPVALRVLPFLAVLSAMTVVGVAATFAWLNRAAPGAGGGWRAAALLLVACGASLAPTLPMGQVGELYGMGANAATAVLVAGCACALWSPAARDEVVIGRVVASVGIASLVAIGALGLAGRAAHFRCTWAAARELNERIVPRVRSAEESGGQLVVFFGVQCLKGRTYGQYVTPAVQAFDLPNSAAWLEAVTPRARIVFTLNSPPVEPAPSELVIDCADLPGRPAY
jgi:hypothetical protein